MIVNGIVVAQADRQAPVYVAAMGLFHRYRSLSQAFGRAGDRPGLPAPRPVPCLCQFYYGRPSPTAGTGSSVSPSPSGVERQ